MLKDAGWFLDWLMSGTSSHWHQWSWDFTLGLREAVDLLYLFLSLELLLRGAICFAFDFVHGTSAFHFSRCRSVSSCHCLVQSWAASPVSVCLKVHREMAIFSSFVITSRADVYKCAIFVWGFVKDVVFWIKMSVLTLVTVLQIVL